jgi:capsular exopolysaccharide synthesis family protein
MVALCTGCAVALALARSPTYSASTQIFVATSAAGRGDVTANAYQGGLFAQQRVTSYAPLVSSPTVAAAVVRQIGDPSLTVRRVQSDASAVVPEGTVLIDITVHDHSARLAKAIAYNLGAVFPPFVERLEASRAGGESPVRLSVTGPPAARASRVAPKKPLYITIGLVLGLVLGITAAVVMEALRKRVRDAADAELAADAALLGQIPHDARLAGQSLASADAQSATGESFRRLRTNLWALRVDRQGRAFVVTSSAPGEGKTFITANLAIAFAEAGQSVIVVDGDVRTRSMARWFNVGHLPGLSDVVLNDVPLSEALQRHARLPLMVLPVGNVEANPSELLSLPRHRTLLDDLAQRADLVLVDAPALLSSSDAAVLARLTDGAILVADARSTRASDLAQAADTLAAVGRPPVGVVLNGSGSAPDRSRRRRPDVDPRAAGGPAGGESPFERVPDGFSGELRA